VAAALVLAAGIVVTGLAGPAVTSIQAAAGGAARRGLPPGQIPQGVALLVERVGLVAGGIIVMALAAGLLAASAQIAARAYERREF
jgi:hypothetical protein